MVTSLEITQLEQEAIDAHLENKDEHCKGVTMMSIPKAADNISWYDLHQNCNCSLLLSDESLNTHS